MATPPEDALGPAPHKVGDFEVRLANFTGPFDLLLSLIAKHKLDVTEIALAQVTDEFIATMRAGGDWVLDTTSEFLVIAATLLDLKAARLLPTYGDEDPDDLELLESRDLLFARLLQYRAYREVAEAIGARLTEQGRWFPRSVALEPQFAALLPELVWSIGASDFAAIAERALSRPQAQATVSLDHLHAPAVSVREQAAIIIGRLRQEKVASFRSLVSDATSALIVVGRFLALLELFRDRLVSFEQITPLGELTVRFTGSLDDESLARGVFAQGSSFDDDGGAD
ncbi:segregation and condensation protein A [Rarobacter incanus]|uniref:Segregation and condensation protein A n=1 Tax=Rarobacter incanus TaxID=153494 RepID=A0A542SM58_9MICO|nr:ScpA family protein [Rarobacter incanus]TQK75711.1 condensin subunit ScpA [Rarobacter incanus]